MKFKIILVLTLIVGIVIASGCTQQSSNNDNASQSNASKTDTFNEFNNLAAKRINQKVSYEQKILIEGNEKIMQLVLYVKGEKLRIDILANGFQTRMWKLPEKAVQCTKLSDQEEEICFEISSTQVQNLQINTEEMEKNKENYIIAKLPSRSIAGEIGNCFKILMTAINQKAVESETCITNDGIMLYNKITTENESTEMIAKSVSRNVTDSDFVLPENIQKLP